MEIFNDHDFLITLDLEDIDHFSEVGHAWDIDFRQLDPGHLNARLLQAITGNVQLVEARFDRRIEQQGCSPADYFTIAVPLSTDPNLVWRRRRVSPGSVLIYRSGSEIDGASRPGFHVVALSIREAAFNRLAVTLGHPEVAGLVGTIDVVSLPAARLQRLQADLRSVCSSLRRNLSGSIRPRQRTMLEHRLPAMMVHALAESVPSPPPSPIRDRQRALRTALDFIDAHRCDAISVRGLCRVTGASERTLQYAFRERFDVTPNAYLKAVRLQAVRRQLRRSIPGRNTIANYANELGFWHMGQFAADYRRHFGELPSETLRRHPGAS